MNKKLLALAIGAAVAAPVVAQAEGPTVYGKVNVSLDNIDTSVAGVSTEDWKLNSNASRLGVKGDYELDGGLKAVYLAEYGIKVDDGAGATISVPTIDPATGLATGTTTVTTAPFSQRNIYGGLKGDFGTLRAGVIDTPLKEAQGKVDQFNDLAADISRIMAGETRLSNTVQYVSPKLGDAFTITLGVAPGESKDLDADGKVDDGIADTLSASLVYDADGLYAALALDTNASASGAVDGFSASRADIVRLVAGYKADAFEVGALFQTAENIATAGVGEDQSVLVSGAYNLDAVKLKAQYGVTEGDVTGEEATLVGVGADYKLGKNSIAFLQVAKVERDLAKTETNTVGLGLEHKF